MATEEPFPGSLCATDNIPNESEIAAFLLRFFAFHASASLNRLFCLGSGVE
jgi:hypothetical protein